MNVVAITQSDDDAPEPEGFEAFWTLYPRKQAKLDARKAWARVNPAIQVDIIVAVASWRRVWLARDDVSYIPHAATWLNGERWEDELPDDGRPASASHVVFKPGVPPPPRGEIPEHVRAQIRKLLGK